MPAFLIDGGKPLCGKVRISGSKNAALPLLFASLAVEGTVTLRNFPDIGDTRKALRILSAFGTRSFYRGGTLTLDCRRLRMPHKLPEEVSDLRGSTYLLGASLARFGTCPLFSSGGCNFGKRPIDLHLSAFESLGAVREDDRLFLPGRRDAVIRFPTVSVGATANALILASATEGETRIEGGAVEPHILALVGFLRSAGAGIRMENGTFLIRGRKLGSVDHTVIPDMIEAGTYLLLAPMTDGDITVTDCDPSELLPLTEAMRQAGCRVEADSEAKTLRATGTPTAKVRLTTAPYPGFPTDLHPPAAAFLLSAGGEIRETVFADRFGYLPALTPFGASFATSGDTLFVYPSALHRAVTTAPDLRGGAAALMLALAAKGRSRIGSAGTVLRGYEDPVGKLRSLGASISLIG